ncbi:MAG: 5,10-methylenetetrahydrofolate reductase, partial [Catenulisporales bacterium]|nr:5,10-methylenetetrahydrofolate reductase [Catenulisporales bacterium]
ARDLTAFCRKLGMPFGFLIESVSIRRVEIEAAATLAREVGVLLGRRAS